jgi:SH3 domain-containing YSC84-like protein 1
MKLMVLFAGLLALGSAFCSSPVYAAGMQGDVDQAATIISRFESMGEQSIPPAVFRDAKGLAVLTVVKAGFIFSGRGGKGVVVARHEDGWSGPSAIGTGGAGFGPQIGVQSTEFVFVLNTDEAVRAFSRGGNLVLGADVSVAAGPVGRNAEVGVTPFAAVYTYSKSQGLFAGASLEGTILATRNDANTAFYGRLVTPQQILAGLVSPPEGARSLENVLAAADSRYCGIGKLACR